MSNARKALTWSRLIEIEPRLLALVAEARAVDGSAAHFCANRVWAERFKPRLGHLVGWDCPRPELATADAWDLACRTIYHALPPCRKCECL